MSRLHDRGQQLLDACVAAMVAAGRPVPERRYIADGDQAAWDFGCDGQLIVSVGPVRQPAQDRPLLVELAALVLRCAPTVDDQGNPPPAQDIDDSAANILADADALIDGFFAFASACEAATMTSITLPGPSGGLVGALLRVTTGLA